MIEDRFQPAYWNLVGPYFKVVSIYDGEAVFLDGLAALPEPSQHLLTSHWTQSEIRNGGFLQYFLNSTGVVAPEAVAAFRAMEMPLTADMLATAMLTFGPSYLRDRDAREKVLVATFPDCDFDDEVDLDGPYPFDDLEKQMLGLLDTEHGGFESAADAYALKSGA